VRYKQTLLGAGWAIIQPLMTMVVFTIFFGHLAKVPSDGLPYPVFSLMALVPWTYFASALAGCSTSLSGYQHIISKVYFPRLIIPIGAVVAPLVDFAIGFAILIGLMAWYRIVPGPSIVWLPALMLLALATAAGVGVWLAALNVRYRDVRYVVPFVVQLWMFATPVAYPASLVPAQWRAVYGLNPMAGVIEGFRWALAGGPAPGVITLVSAAVVVVLIAGGAHYFRRLEGTFADVI
jgi:lipopolysaccharide transport system permease protein